MDAVQVAAGAAPVTPAGTPVAATPAPNPVTPDAAQTAQGVPAEPEYIDIPRPDGSGLYTRVEKSKLPEVWMNKETERARLVAENEQLKARQYAQPQEPANSQPGWVPIANQILDKLQRARPGADVDDLKAIARVQAEAIFETRQEMKREMNQQLQINAEKSRFDSLNQQIGQQYGVNLLQDPVFMDIYNRMPSATSQDHVDLWLLRTGRGVNHAQAPATTNGINGAAASRSNGSVYATPGIGGGPANEAQMSPFMQNAFARNPEMKPGHPHYEKFRAMVAAEEQKLNPYGSR